MKHIALAAIGGLFLTTSAMAEQTGAFTVRLDADAKNVGACDRLIEPEAAARPHTVTVGGGSASAKSAGGLNFALKSTAPDLYQSAEFIHRGTQFILVVDMVKKNLVVTDRRLGCRWSGVLK